MYTRADARHSVEPNWLRQQLRAAHRTARMHCHLLPGHPGRLCCGTHARVAGNRDHPVAQRSPHNPHKGCVRGHVSYCCPARLRHTTHSAPARQRTAPLRRSTRAPRGALPPVTTTVTANRGRLVHDTVTTRTRLRTAKAVSKCDENADDQSNRLHAQRNHRTTVLSAGHPAAVPDLCTNSSTSATCSTVFCTL